MEARPSLLLMLTGGAVRIFQNFVKFLSYSGQRPSNRHQPLKPEAL